MADPTTTTSAPKPPQLPGLSSLESQALSPNPNTFIPSQAGNSSEAKGMQEAVNTNTALSGANAANYVLPQNMQQSYTAIQNQSQDMLNPDTGQVQDYNTAHTRDATAGKASASLA